MERLTEKHFGNEGYYMKCSEDCHAPQDCIDCAAFEKLVDRLAAYEDTGLLPEDFKKAFNEDALLKLTAQYLRTTPDRLIELTQADKEGRLVALPCKVGDTVYIPTIEKQNVDRVRVQGISISVSGRAILRFGGYPIGSAWGDGCGKDWFLTREEAEAALAGEGGKHETD